MREFLFFLRLQRQFRINSAINTTEPNGVPLENFSPRFFGIKTASSSLIIFQRAKLSTWSNTHLCWYNWRPFSRKKPREFQRVVLVLARQSPGSPGTSNTEETDLPGLPVSWSPPYSPDLEPSEYHVFRGLKRQLKYRHFSSAAEVIFAAETWLNGQISDFFERFA